MLNLAASADHVTFEVRVTPGASRSALLGVREGMLRLSLAAPAVDGAANDALRRFLSKKLRVPPSAIEILRGQRSRTKTLRIRGVSAEQLQALAET